VKELPALWDSWNTANVKPLWGRGKADNDGPELGRALLCEASFLKPNGLTRPTSGRPYPPN